MMWFEPTPFVLGGAPGAHLQVKSLSAGYGAFLVLRNLSLEIHAAQGLVGPDPTPGRGAAQ